MSTKSKRNGTWTEVRTERFLADAGLPVVARHTLRGSQDEGDIWIADGRVVVECKHRIGAHSWGDVDRWLTELDAEVVNVLRKGKPVDLSALVVKRVGSGEARVADWHVYMRPGDAAYLLTGLVVHDSKGWVAMRLGQWAELTKDRLRMGGM